MRDFDDSTLWRISEFERVRAETGTTGYARLSGGSTVLPTTMMAELSQLERKGARDDVLEVLAAVMRQRDNLLIYLGLDELVWPLSVFPREMLYHAPRDLVPAIEPGAHELKLLSMEPPGVRPPGHWQSERVTDATRYRPLNALLWALALHGPRPVLIDEIAGSAAYRITSNFHLGSLPHAGAIGPALQRLRVEIAPLRDIARWPGMDLERASRLLNALYLQNGLMVLRSHPSASADTGADRGWRQRLRRGR